MILPGENKNQPGEDQPEVGEAAGPSGSTSTSGKSDVSVTDILPPPYSPERDPHVDLLEGEGVVAVASPFPASPPSISSAIAVSQIPRDLPRQNRLRVNRENSGISDTYVIDPTLPAPPGSHDKALSLFSRNGSIEATVFLTQSPGRTLKGRVELEGLSLNGSLRFSVAECPENMRVSILVETRNGSIALFLPPTFRGPLTINHENGIAHITPALKSRTRTLDETAGMHRCWVGEWGDDDDPNWVADECVVGSHNGSVKVGYWDPVEATKSQIPKGILEKVFGQKK